MEPHQRIRSDGHTMHKNRGETRSDVPSFERGKFSEIGQDGELCTGRNMTEGTCPSEELVRNQSRPRKKQKKTRREMEQEKSEESLFAVLSRHPVPTIEDAQNVKPVYLSFRAKRLARIRSMHQYPRAMEVLQKFQNRKLLKSSEFLKTTASCSGGILPFALLEALALDISVNEPFFPGEEIESCASQAYLKPSSFLTQEPSSKTKRPRNPRKENRLLYKNCQKMTYDCRQYVLRYFFIAAVHLATPMGQLGPDDFYDLDILEEALDGVIHEDFATWAFEYEDPAHRDNIRDAWTIVHNVIASKICSYSRANRLLFGNSFQNMKNDGKDWARLCIRQMGYWLFEKFSCKTPYSNKKEFEYSFCESIVPLLSVLLDRMVLELVQDDSDQIERFEKNFMLQGLHSNEEKHDSLALYNVDPFFGKCHYNKKLKKNRAKNLKTHFTLQEVAEFKKAESLSAVEHILDFVLKEATRYRHSVSVTPVQVQTECIMSELCPVREPASSFQTTQCQDSAKLVIDVDMLSDEISEEDPAVARQRLIDALPDEPGDPFVVPSIPGEVPYDIAKGNQNESPDSVHPKSNVDTLSCERIPNIPEEDLITAPQHLIEALSHKPGENSLVPLLSTRASACAWQENKAQGAESFQHELPTSHVAPFSSKRKEDAPQTICVKETVPSSPRSPKFTPTTSPIRASENNYGGPSSPSFSCHTAGNLISTLPDLTTAEPKTAPGVRSWREQLLSHSGGSGQNIRGSQLLVESSWQEYVRESHSCEPYSRMILKEKEEDSDPACQSGYDRVTEFLEYVLQLQVSDTAPRAELLSSLPYIGNDASIARFTDDFLNLSFMRKNPNEYDTIAEFTKHWEEIAKMELLGCVPSMTKPIFKTMNEILKAVRRPAGPVREVESQDFAEMKYWLTRLSVKSVSCSTMHCTSLPESTDENALESTLCMGVLFHEGFISERFLCFIRKRERITAKGRPGEPRIHVGNSISVEISRRFYDSLPNILKIIPGIETYDNYGLNIVPIENLSTLFRQFKMLYCISELPERIQRTLINSGPLAGESEIDGGSEAYIRLQERVKNLNVSQANAVRKVFHNIGRCEKYSSSLTLIQGPPGTGKSTTIQHIIGAMLHHSTSGHAKGAQRNYLHKKDNIWRHCNDKNSVRILVMAPSNVAADLLCANLSIKKIDDMENQRLEPQCARLASRRYKSSCNGHVLQNKALDYECIVRPNREVRTAGKLAKRLLMRESIILFTTTGMVAGKSFQDLGARFDIVIIDEGSQGLEHEVLSAIVSCYYTNWDASRLHIVMVGDHKQLRPHSHLEMLFSTRDLQRAYAIHTRSLFHGLILRQNISSAMLNIQYRMSEYAAGLHSKAFYRGLVRTGKLAESPRFLLEPRERNPWFVPLVFIDTSRAKSKYEERGPGMSFVNKLEADVVLEVLHQLKKNISYTRSWTKDICIITGYSGQENYINSLLQENFMNEHASTVDSTQGSEASIVILSCTRSNLRHSVGFLSNENRINVATSRFKDLFIIIGDSETLMEGPIDHKLRVFIEACHKDYCEGDKAARFYVY